MENQDEREVWWCPDHSFSKAIITKGYGFNTPQDGSLCKVQILSDEHSLIQPLDSDMTKEVTIGEADTELDKILENCISTMKEEEICELVIMKQISSDEEEEIISTSPSEENAIITESNSTKECGENQSEENLQVVEQQTNTEAASDETPKLEDATDTLTAPKVKLQLLCYSREPEIWEMSITEKWRRASHHKAKGVELYTARRYKWAFRRFSQSLRYIISLEHDIPPEHNLHEQEGQHL